MLQGKNGCPCANTTASLALFPDQDRRCQLPDGDDGIRLVSDGALGACVPFSYGSSRCLQHDLLHDPGCREDPVAGDRVVPAYCLRMWCYVNVATCTTESDERAFRSSYFPRGSGVNLFYSYSTCNSTAEDWFAVEEDILGSASKFGGISIAANIPTYNIPSECDFSLFLFQKH